MESPGATGRVVRGTPAARGSRWGCRSRARRATIRSVPCRGRGEPAHGDVVRADRDGLTDRADIGEDVSVESRTPFGSPAPPEVYWISAASSPRRRGEASERAPRERGRYGDMAQRAHPRAQQAGHSLGLRERDQRARLGVVEDAHLPLRILLDPIRGGMEDRWAPGRRPRAGRRRRRRRRPPRVLNISATRSPGATRRSRSPPAI